MATATEYRPATPAWHRLDPHPVQSALWGTDKRFVAVPAGRGSGKTELAKRRLVRSLPIRRRHNQTHMYAYLSPTRGQAKRIAWNDLKAMVPKSWVVGLPSESGLIIRTSFRGVRAELHVIGMDKPQRFEGNQWDGVVLDEASDQKREIFNRTIRPALTHRRGWCWMIGVPKRQGIGAKDYRAFCELGFKKPGDKDYDPEWCAYTWPSWDILPKDEIERAKTHMDLKDYLEQYGASWQTIGGSAFYNFDEDSHVGDYLPDYNRTILVASDFNVNPMAWTLNQLLPDGSGLVTFDEIWLRNTNTQHALDVLWNRHGEFAKGGWEFYGDAASKQRHTSASASDYAQIKNWKRINEDETESSFKARTIYPAANPHVKDRLASCNKLLRDAAGRVRWHIAEKCENLIGDLMNRGLDSEGMPDDDGDIGHITDAAGYLIHVKWPSTRLDHSAATSIGIFNGE